ncbi:helix-turn-helix domain-containing protein [uncultured Flavonifractor sp.]|uniref:helix-turn-helix domain-containing protein n=1 Tax=uncultured Flavonifractor sp. TaxID=1193534 RepID=UPI002613B173|nr:helix-turn-helix domain-containing protein [uncultured Flavonifractor sp.]
MDLTKYYPVIAAKYPAYVTQRELCEICGICAKTAYNLERRGEIHYTIQQNHLIRTHRIKLTDILAYLYRCECKQEANGPYIRAMRTFYDKHLSPYPDLLSVKDIQQITGFSSSAIVRWISTGILKAFQPGKRYTVPKTFMLDFLTSPYYRRIRRKTSIQKELMDTFERLWQGKGGE